MSLSLSTPALNLFTNNFEYHRVTGKVFKSIEMPLVTRKGVYPYDYNEDDIWDKLEEYCLPPINQLYNILNEADITDEDYNHAVKVWQHFSCQTLGAYSDLYLKNYVLFFVDLFENF